MKIFLSVITLLLSVVYCHGQNSKSAKNSESQALNQLTIRQKAAGWKLLFDGKTITGWHKYGTDSIGKAWEVNNDAIHLNVSDKKDWQSKNGGDLISASEFGDFHFKIDWKIAKNGNSGLIFYVNEDPKTYKYPWMTGPEMQVLDNDGHPDSKIIKHRAGDLYDLITAKEAVKPVGEWNTAEIISRKGVLEFRLNGQRILLTKMWDENWKKMIAGSKFHEFPGFGTFKKGKLCLQDHGDKVWFRNIMIREL